MTISVRVITIGATGRVGTHLLERMAADKFITHIVSLVDQAVTASPFPSENPTIENRKVDLHHDLSEHFRFADAVVYLSWLITGTERGGSKNRSASVLRNVCAGLETAQIRTFIYGSAVGASDPRLGTPLTGGADESGHAHSDLTQEISLSERCIDEFEVEHAMTRTVRLRPGLIACPSAKDDGMVGRSARGAVRVLLENHRLRLVPSFGPRPISIVHVDDLAEAISLALNSSAIGTFHVVTDPVTPDLLAQLFGAKAVRVKPRTVEVILAVARRLGLHALDPEWFVLALRPGVEDVPPFDQDAWTCRHAAASILHEWIGTGEPTLSVPVEIAAAPPEPIDLRSLYRDAVTYFASLVHGLADDQWSQQSEYQDWTIWQVVASAALAQYRLALLLKHEGNEAEIDTLLPGDPLGIAPVDGWDLAAEQGVLALGASDEVVAVGATMAIDPTAERFVSDAICEIVLLGSSLALSVAAPESLSPQLEEFVHRRRAGLDSGSP
jgi:nucleoside-diphosphate-sugar epimerase